MSPEGFHRAAERRAQALSLLALERAVAILWHEALSGITFRIRWIVESMNQAR